MSGDRTMRWRGLAIGFLFLLGGVLLWGSRLEVSQSSDLSCIVEDTRTGGGAGIERWARKLGFQTHALRVPLPQAEEELPGAGHVLISASNRLWGSGFPSEDLQEWSSIRRWVENGNTLILITTQFSNLYDGAQDLFLAGSKDHQPKAVESSRSRFSIDPVAKVDIPTRWGGNLAVDSQGPRLKGLPPEMQFAGDEDLTVLAGAPLGEGMLILLLDESAWVNEGFDQADHAATLWRVLTDRIHSQGTLAFDEHRHGRGHPESFVTAFFSLPGSVSAAWIFALLTGLAMWAASRRLGPPDVLQGTERRTAREYIDSIAAMNQRARAAPIALESILRRVQSVLGAKGRTTLESQNLFQSAEKLIALADRPRTPNVEMATACELIRLRKDNYELRTDSRTSRDHADSAAEGRPRAG